MATWQDLYEMLLDESLRPHEIVARLNVRPSRLKRMLASKRLAARLETTEQIAERRSAHLLATSAEPAVRKLTDLLGAEGDETVRRACLNVLEVSGQVRQARPERPRGDFWSPQRPAERPGKQRGPARPTGPPVLPILDPAPDWRERMLAETHPAGQGTPAGSGAPGTGSPPPPSEAPPARGDSDKPRPAPKPPDVPGQGSRRRAQRFREEPIAHDGDGPARRARPGR